LHKETQKNLNKGDRKVVKDGHKGEIETNTGTVDLVK